MIDLGFLGPRYTWSNHHPLSHLIQERIDRAYANADWNVLYPDASVKHLKRAHSDHNPILIITQFCFLLQMYQEFNSLDPLGTNQCGYPIHLFQR